MLSISHISDLHFSDRPIIFLHGHRHELDEDAWAFAQSAGIHPAPPRAMNPPPINAPVLRRSRPSGSIPAPATIGGRRVTLDAPTGLSDQRLIAACDAAIELSDEIKTVALRENWPDARIDEATDRYNGLVRLACAIPARTDLGLAAKARLADDQRRGESDGYDEVDCILTSLFRDLNA